MVDQFSGCTFLLMQPGRALRPACYRQTLCHVTRNRRKNTAADYIAYIIGTHQRSCNNVVSIHEWFLIPGCYLRPQVVENTASLRMQDGQPLEAVIMAGLAHPHIVHTIAHSVVCTAHADYFCALTLHHFYRTTETLLQKSSRVLGPSHA